MLAIISLSLFLSHPPLRAWPISYNLAEGIGTGLRD